MRALGTGAAAHCRIGDLHRDVRHRPRVPRLVRLEYEAYDLTSYEVRSSFRRRGPA